MQEPVFLLFVRRHGFAQTIPCNFCKSLLYYYNSPIEITETEEIYLNIPQKLAAEFQLRQEQIDNTIALLDDGKTIPFIARYRKERTGSLDDQVLRAIDNRLQYLRKLEQRKDEICTAIEAQGKLTPELEQKIRGAETLVETEDLYLPYRPKRKTRASMAIARGLEPLARILMAQNPRTNPAQEAEAFLQEEVPDTEAALQGAMDILAEEMANDADLRKQMRRLVMSAGTIQSRATEEDADTPYQNYYDYAEPVKRIVGHRILAIDRGEREGALKVAVTLPEGHGASLLIQKFVKNQSPCGKLVQTAAEDAFQRLLFPAVERETRKALTEQAATAAIGVFASNLRQLLMAAPLKNRIVLGVDPGYRTGCKLAVVDETGKVLDTTVVYPTAPTTEAKIKAAKETVKKMIEKYHIDLISVGNGTACRESEQVIVDMLKEVPTKVQYVITNEAGASVYSASKLATEEFPNFDVGQRSAASIARRLQDPLAELVKIDPKAIGVGQYQHDMNQKKLGEALNGVVEDCVNKVGVDLNTASASLLEYISGISKAIAKNIVAYREENGRFTDRRELLKVAKLGPKAFEQCAGFMRIQGGKNPLDATSVHPESYEAVEKLFAKQGFTKEQYFGDGPTAIYIKDYKKLAEELGIGEITLHDIIKELGRPGRDPREDMPKPILRSDVLDMKDLKEGMILKGTVRNVIDFGAFVDIGVHQDGLVHISQISDKYIKHPLEVVSVGDVVDVKVISVDLNKKRIGLSMRGIR